VIAKRYKQEVSQTLLGLLRHYSNNNTPMLAAFRRLRERKILTLTEKVAYAAGFYSMIRDILEASDFLKDPMLRSSKLLTGVLEYSRVILMTLLDAANRIATSPAVVQALESAEVYQELDFVCPYSMKQIEHPVEIRLDNGDLKVRGGE
jgi:hypothetical protein